MINELTGATERLARPTLSDSERECIVELCRLKPDKALTWNGRVYWADKCGAVYVVAFRNNDIVSGDTVGGEA